MQNPNVVEGEVAKILKHGAFVRLADGTTGFVHISEVADAFVNRMEDYLAEGDRILVKKLGINHNHQADLSYKQAGCVKIQEKIHSASPATRTFPTPFRPSVKIAPQTFEEKLKSFMQASEERQGELRRNLENKRGGKSSRL